MLRMLARMDGFARTTPVDERLAGPPSPPGRGPRHIPRLSPASGYVADRGAPPEEAA